MGWKNRTAVIAAAMALAALTLATACRDQGPQGEVKATEAYVEAFGEAPTPQKGRCFARVGYLPLKEQPDRVVPVPLFLFSEKEQLFQLTERLVHMAHFAPLRAEQVNPFPGGTALRSVTRDGGVATVELAFAARQPTAAQVMAMSRMIASTIGQFPGIDKVRLLAGEQPLPGTPNGGIGPDPSWRAAPGKPALLVVVGNWEESGRLKEILVNFDRPVEVEKIAVTDGQGQRVEGEYYQSAFDMAVVIHPEKKDRYDEGTPLRVAWTVADRLGRGASGEGVHRLVRHEHRDAEQATD